VEVLGACKDGILHWSWEGWNQVCSMRGVSLFGRGCVASNEELQRTNGGGPESWGAAMFNLYKAQRARFLIVSVALLQLFCGMRARKH
jgi:hypothetical protein